ncbi:hypothetical protein [Persicobacter diffluens]|uniref:Uncharacterized protein n=1 Tax=Persicobacter diffluens TaxID=981 RepID=A0AAN4W2F0_9BACT|nr:hypothetical protein PEDI_40030 [Persicobacter diffluens]
MDKVKNILDFKELFEYGRELLGDYGSKYWTDHNIHDPGITILEQLALATADMIYRAQRNPEQILFSSNQNQNTLLSPQQAFPSGAITEKDLRKVIYDQIPEARNIWVSPIEDGHHIKGLYEIFVDIDLVSNSQEEISKIKAKVAETFYKNRNLGEDLESIHILKKQPLALCGSIEIQENYNRESILAAIYHQIEDFIRPQINYLDPEQYHSIALGEEKLYAGPRLKNGIILDDQLRPKLKRILLSEITKIILDTEGVKRLENFKIQLNEEEFEEQLEISKFSKPSLILPEEESTYTLKIKKENESSSNPDFISFLRRYKEKTTHIHSNSEGGIQEINAKLVEEDLSSYYSIQHDFPNIYRLGEDGIGLQAPQEVKGKIFQLKGFLMLLEQIMANFFGQLDHVKHLYSAGTEDSKTYHFIPLEGIPLMDQILDTEKPEDYPGLLTKLGKTIEAKQLRKSRFLDYLLSLYGEEYPTYSDQNINLKGKRALLQEIHHLNLSKNKGEEVKEQGIIPAGLIQRTNQFFNLNPKEFSNFENGIEVTPEVDASQILKKLPATLDFLDEDDLVEYKKNQQIREHAIPEWVFQSGLNSSNYLLDFANPSQVFLQNMEDKSISTIQQVENKEEAIQFIGNFERQLNQLNEQSNSLGFLEHIRLRPRPEEGYFGIYLKNKEGKTVLASTNTYSIEERQLLIPKIFKSLQNASMFYVANNGNQTFSLAFKDEKENIQFEGLIAEISVEKIHHDLDEIVEYFSHISETYFKEKVIDYFIKYEDGVRIRENQINYSGTVCFPSWSIPLGQSAFREKVMKYMIEHKPAFVDLKFISISFQEWVAFKAEKEKLYYGKDDKIALAARRNLAEMLFNTFLKIR